MIQILTSADIPTPQPSDIANQRDLFLSRIETAATFREYTGKHREYTGTHRAN